MPQPRPNLSRIAIQAQIMAKFGPERIQELRERLCTVCLFRELHGGPCQMLPITSEGKECEYFARIQRSLPGGYQND